MPKLTIYDRKGKKVGTYNVEPTDFAPRINKQLSDSRCTSGQTWDYDDRDLWVSNGCRARFSVQGGNAGRIERLQDGVALDAHGKDERLALRFQRPEDEDQRRG